MNFVKSILLLIIPLTCSQNLLAEKSENSSSIEQCLPAVMSWCSHQDCGLFFDHKMKPISAKNMIPLTIELLAKRRAEILDLADEFAFDARSFVGALIVANVKLSSERVRCGSSALDLHSGVDSGAARFGSGVDSGVDRLDSGVDSGADRLDSGVDSGADRLDSGVDSGADRLDSGVDSGAARLDSGVDSGAARFDSGVDSGAARLDSGINSGSKPTTFSAPQCLGNIGRLDHNAPYLAEQYLAKFENRQQMGVGEINGNLWSHKDLRYAAALFASNKEIFEMANLTYDVPIASTLYFLADVEKVAERISRERRQPKANSFGLYALCNKDLIDEILRIK